MMTTILCPRKHAVTVAKAIPVVCAFGDLLVPVCTGSVATHDVCIRAGGGE